MKDSRKSLKIISIVVIIFTLSSLLGIVSELLYGEFDNVEIPADAPENILLITKIVVLSIAILLILPQIYIGVKGLKEAKHPGFSRAHIFWARVLFVLAIIGLISSVAGILNGDAVKENIRSLLNLAVEIFLYYDYIKFAKAVSDGM